MGKSLLKLFYWEIRNREKRFSYINALIRNVPGEFGIQLRSKIIPKYFKKAGKNITIFQGVRYRNEQNISVGNDVTIGLNMILQGAGGIEIGNYSFLGPGVMVWTSNHIFSDTEVPIRTQGSEHKPVTIGNDVWVGSLSFIMPGVNIPDGCIVSAGSVVGIKNYKPYSLIAGNPARVIGNRKKLEKAE